MKIRTLAVLAALLYLPLISNAGMDASQNPITPASKGASAIHHDHDIVIVYGGEDVRPKQLNQDIVV